MIVVEVRARSRDFFRDRDRARDLNRDRVKIAIFQKIARFSRSARDPDHFEYQHAIPSPNQFGVIGAWVGPPNTGGLSYDKKFFFAFCGPPFVGP